MFNTNRGKTLDSLYGKYIINKEPLSNLLDEWQTLEQAYKQDNYKGDEIALHKAIKNDILMIIIMAAGALPNAGQSFRGWELKQQLDDRYPEPVNNKEASNG